MGAAPPRHLRETSAGSAPPGGGPRPGRDSGGRPGRWQALNQFHYAVGEGAQLGARESMATSYNTAVFGKKWLIKREFKESVAAASLPG